jgi:hypothetical protein
VAGHSFKLNGEVIMGRITAKDLVVEKKLGKNDLKKVRGGLIPVPIGKMSSKNKPAKKKKQAHGGSIW